MNNKTLDFFWMYPQKDTDKELLVDFFIAHINDHYISHSEVLKQRALNASKWSPSLREKLMHELNLYTENSNYKAAVVTYGDSKRILGLALVEVLPRARLPHAWIHDFIVDTSLRKRKIGLQFLTWLENEFMNENIKLLILESGISNKVAHSFFEHKKFDICSVIMTKTLS